MWHLTRVPRENIHDKAEPHLHVTTYTTPMWKPGYIDEK